jgi:ribosome-associated heat shock protein Hsp15
MSDPLHRVRLDKWLWAARFFRTRSLATAAAEAGRVHVGGERAKPAKALKIGDRLDVRIGPWRWSVDVVALAERRGPASVARTLYVERPESIAERLALAAQQRASRPSNPLHRGRPTKKQRRDFDRTGVAADAVDAADAASGHTDDDLDAGDPDRWQDPEAWDFPDDASDAAPVSPDA